MFLRKKRHSKCIFALFSDKSTQTKADSRKRSNVWDDPSLVKIPKTVVSPETVKSSTKLDLPGQQQMSVTFIPNQGSSSSTVDHQGTVDVSHLQGVLSNFMTNNTTGTLPTEVEEACCWPQQRCCGSCFRQWRRYGAKCSGFFEFSRY